MRFLEANHFAWAVIQFPDAKSISSWVIVLTSRSFNTQAMCRAPSHGDSKSVVAADESEVAKDKTSRFLTYPVHFRPGRANG